MSLDPILWALKDAPVADSLERLVLVTLAERAARADGSASFPSRDTIADTVLADPKTVQRILQRLVKRGLIAKGDQSAARYIRADRRPVVYDLLIPYSWFPNPARMNAERAQAGLPPLTPKDRPDIALAPERKRRSDVGKPRPKKEQRGDCESPRPESHGGTDSPSRGDSESRTGGLRDPRYSPMNHPEEPLSHPAVDDEPAARVEPQGEREKKQPTGNPAADAVVAAYLGAIHRPVSTATRAKLRQQAAQLLADGFPAAWLADRARELAERGWTDLAQHCDRSTVPTVRVATDSRTGWCGRCSDPNHRMVKDRARDNELVQCPDCHPAAVARRRRAQQGDAA